ncbi:MAG: glycosyl transferase family 4 [Veillonella parvula]
MMPVTSKVTIAKFNVQNNILYKYIRYRFRRIQIQYNMLYDIAPEEQDEICRNLLNKRAKILIPVGILYFLLFGVIFAWLVGTSEELNPLMQWELRVIDYVIPILNTIDIKWYAYPLDLLWVAIILAPIAIINASPYIIFSYIVDTILIQHEVKALIKEYSIYE